MLDSLFKMFLNVADCGSFSKTAEKLCISPVAVMKQMNVLEEQIGIRLLLRSNQGVKLTEAGKSLYNDVQFVKQFSDDALKRLHRVVDDSRHIIRVGTSLLNPCNILMDLWNNVGNNYPQFTIKVVPFEDDANVTPLIYRTIGKNFDLFFGAYDSVSCSEYLNALELGKYNFCIAVSRKRPLASKSKLLLSDLYGEQFMMVKRGNSILLDSIRQYILSEHPEIQIIDTPYHYDIEVFNYCERSGAVILTYENQSNIHPSLVRIPVEWDFTIPYGVLYSKTPAESVKEFTKIIAELQ